MSVEQSRFANARVRTHRRSSQDSLRYHLEAMTRLLFLFLCGVHG